VYGLGRRDIWKRRNIDVVKESDAGKTGKLHDKDEARRLD